MAKAPWPTGPQWGLIILGAVAAAGLTLAIGIGGAIGGAIIGIGAARIAPSRTAVPCRNTRSARAAAERDVRRPAPRELAGAAPRRVRQPLYAGAEELPRRREAGGQAHLPQGRRMVRGARPDAARQGPRRHPRAGSLSRPRPGAWPVLLGPAGVRPRRAWSTSTRSWRPTSASARRGTASSSIGRGRACCC